MYRAHQILSQEPPTELCDPESISEQTVRQMMIDELGQITGLDNSEIEIVKFKKQILLGYTANIAAEQMLFDARYYNGRLSFEYKWNRYQSLAHRPSHRFNALVNTHVQSRQQLVSSLHEEQKSAQRYSADPHYESAKLLFTSSAIFFICALLTTIIISSSNKEFDQTAVALFLMFSLGYLVTMCCTKMFNKAFTALAPIEQSVADQLLEDEQLFVEQSARRAELFVEQQQPDDLLLDDDLLLSDVSEQEMPR